MLSYNGPVIIETLQNLIYVDKNINFLTMFKKL